MTNYNSRNHPKKILKSIHNPNYYPNKLSPLNLRKFYLNPHLPNLMTSHLNLHNPKSSLYPSKIKLSLCLLLLRTT